MIRLLIAFTLLLAAPAAALGQARDAAPGLWTRGDGRITFAAARISLPLRAGAVALTQQVEFSLQGQGVDNGLQFATQDREVFATIYIYLPGLPHAGLAAFATNEMIRTHGGTRLRTLGSRTVGAAGRDGIALRTDYADYREALASSAAFLKAGRWIVKIRVSGPEARRAEVEAAMAALLDGLRFEGEVQPHPPAPFEVGICADPAGGAARALTSQSEDIMQYALLGQFDGAGEEARDERGARTEPLLPRVGTRWCRRTLLRIGEASYPVLHADAGASTNGLGGRSVLLVPIQDAGTMLEMVETTEPRRFVLMHHQVGRTVVLGAYDGPLTNEQIAAILSGADRDGGRIRATVRHLPSGNTEMEVPLPDPAAPSPIPRPET